MDLVAGTRYYIDAFWGEDVFTDLVQVAWRKVGDSTAAINLTPIPGSFLSAFLDATPQPTLSFVRTESGVTLTFDGILQSADVITDEWTDVTDAVSPYPVTTDGIQKFYRTKQ